MSFEYWVAAVEGGLELANVELTSKQIETIASAVEGSFENYSTGTGRDCIPNPYKTELDDLKRSSRKNVETLEEQHRRSAKDYQDTIYRLHCRIDDLQNTIGELRRQI